jgi:nucleoside-diphosphate-sugar epimerase
MTIAVIGGAGFIGTQLVKLLREEGSDVRIIDVRTSAVFREISLTADIRDKEQLIGVLRGCNEIYHLAAEHRDDVAPVSQYYEVNSVGTANLVEVADRLDINTIVFTSTVAVYGLDAEESSETCEPVPFNDYGKSKLRAEETLKVWAHQKTGRRLVIVRLAATFGPGNRGNLYRMMRAIRSRRFVTVGSGRNRKSIAYVGNVAAFLRTCRYLPIGTTVVNYADKPDLTTSELVRTVRQTFGRSGSGPRVPLAVGLVGGAVLGLVSLGGPRALPVILSRIRKFSSSTVVQTNRLDTLGFRAPCPLAKALRDTAAAEFGARARSSASSGKMVYVINHLDWFWSHRLPLALKAQQLGWDVIVAAPDAADAARLAAHGFRAIDITASRQQRQLVALLRNFWQVRCLLKRERPALLHAITLKTALPAALAGRWLGTDVPIVVTIAGLGHLFCSDSWKTKLARLVLAPLIRSAFTWRRIWVVFQNSSDRDALVQQRAIRLDQSIIIPGSGVDLAEFRHVAERSSASPIVLMASRLVHEKGIKVFAETARLLKAGGYRARFVLAGGLDLTNPSAVSAEQMRALTADGAIEWLGHVDDLADLYARCAVFVYPSYYGEGVPKVLLEAAASGRPIVTTDHPGCRDVVTDGVNGVIVPVRNAEATAAAVARLLDDPQLRANFGNRSRERAVREFDVQLVVRATIAFYMRALTGSSSKTTIGNVVSTSLPETPASDFAFDAEHRSADASSSR